MKKSSWIIALFLVYLVSFNAIGQITIRSSNISHRTDLKSICQLIIVNQSPIPISAKIHIEILNRANGDLMCEVETSIFTINQGLFFWIGDVSTFKRISYGNSQAAQKYKSNGVKSGVSLEVCYNLYAVNTEERIGFLCEDLNPFETAAVQLMSPSDNEIVENCYPVLRWSLGGIEASSSYSLLLADIDGHKNTSDAIKKGPYNYYNNLINQNFLVINPISARLIDGHWYAWQVGSNENGKMENESEIFTFKYQCKDANKNVAFTLSVDTSHRMLKTRLDDGFYRYPTNTLPISILNNYQDTFIVFGVFRDTIISTSPFFTDTLKNMKIGLNYYKKTITGLLAGKKYVIEAKNLSNQYYYMRFRYQ